MRLKFLSAFNIIKRYRWFLLGISLAALCLYAAITSLFLGYVSVSTRTFVGNIYYESNPVRYIVLVALLALGGVGIIFATFKHYRKPD